jgi:hypothetical protein
VARKVEGWREALILEDRQLLGVHAWTLTVEKERRLADDGRNAAVACGDGPPLHSAVLVEALGER